MLNTTLRILTIFLLSVFFYSSAKSDCYDLFDDLLITEFNYSPDYRRLLLNYSNSDKSKDKFAVFDIKSNNMIRFNRNNNEGSKSVYLQGDAFFLNNDFLISFSQDSSNPYPALINLNAGVISKIKINNSDKKIPYQNASYVPDKLAAFTTGKLADGRTGIYLWDFKNFSTENPMLEFPLQVAGDLFKYKPAGREEEILPNEIIKTQKISNLNFIFSTKTNKYYGIISVDEDLYQSEHSPYLNASVYFVEIDPIKLQIKFLGTVLTKYTLPLPETLDHTLLYYDVSVQIVENSVLVIAKNAEHKKQIILSEELN